jgi:hypothetical protein
LTTSAHHAAVAHLDAAMRPTLLALAVLSLAVPAVGPIVARAQTFNCTEATAGQLSCQAGTARECHWFHASAMEGTPAGWRWDCGILRPRCAENFPATIDDYSEALPDSLSLSEQSVTVDQDNRQLQWLLPRSEGEVDPRNLQWAVPQDGF